MKKYSLSYEEATNGSEALKAYQTTKLPYKVVFMGKLSPYSPSALEHLFGSPLCETDLSMPVMDGMTATIEIRKYERSRAMKPATIVALTGLASASARVEAMNSGVDDLLTKPLKFTQLMPFLGLR